MSGVELSSAFNPLVSQPEGAAAAVASLFGGIAPLRHSLPAAAMARYEAFCLDLEDGESTRSTNEARSGAGSSTVRQRGERQLARAAAARRIIFRLRDFLNAPAQCRYKMAQFPKVKFTPEALVAAQKKVDDLKAKASTLENAPLPAAERAAAMKSQVAEWRRHGRPNLTANGAQMNSVDPAAMLLFLAWLVPEDVWDERINQLAGDEQPHAVGFEERTKSLTALRKKISDAELVEVALVDASEGLAFHRSTTSEEALLGLTKD